MSNKKLIKENVRLNLKIKYLETELSLNKSMVNDLRADNAKIKASLGDLKDFLQHEDDTYKHHENWWETRLARWKKKMREFYLYAERSVHNAVEEIFSDFNVDGVQYNPFLNSWKFSKSSNVNYMFSAINSL